MHCRANDEKAFRTLNVVDEYGRECLANCVDRKLNSGEAIDVPNDLLIMSGVPSYIHSDNGREFIVVGCKAGT